ncbi:MAG: hypothetical protein LBS45_03965 [Synergistaceae bacterium]|jgi:hypothetical protein|nr:hypothetical protein [Synergistaceae bacterium]
MRAVSIEDLRETIVGMGGDDSPRNKNRQREISAVVESLREDILAALYRGVTWTALAATLSEKLGYKIHRDAIRTRVTRMTKPPKPREKKPGAPASAPPQKLQQGKGHFVIAAVTPDGKLYQLEHQAKINERPGGGYRIYESDADGELCEYKAADFPCSIRSKDAAVKQFKAWAKGRGYEIYGGA